MEFRSCPSITILLLCVVSIGSTVSLNIQKTVDDGTTDKLRELKDELNALRQLVQKLQQTVAASAPPQQQNNDNVQLDAGLSTVQFEMEGKEQDILRQDEVETIQVVDPLTRTRNDEGGLEQQQVIPAGQSSTGHDPEIEVQDHNLTSHPTDPSSNKSDEPNFLQPKVQLFVENSTEPSEEFDFEGKPQGSCLKLNPTQTIESLDTFGSCVRLYNDPDCEGHSLAYYPRSEATTLDKTQKRFLKSARAISPCFENELDPSTTNKTMDSSGEVKGYKKMTSTNNLLVIPDLVFLGLGQNIQFVPARPIHWFKTGQGGRVEMVRAAIQLDDVVRAQRQPYLISRATQNYYGGLEKMEGDRLGFYVGPVFGPQQFLPFHNVFPQSMQSARLVRRMESEVMSTLLAEAQKGNDGSRVRMNLNMDYENKNSTRPIGMGCILNFDSGIRRMMYITNVLPSVEVREPK